MTVEGEEVGEPFNFIKGFKCRVAMVDKTLQWLEKCIIKESKEDIEVEANMESFKTNGLCGV